MRHHFIYCVALLFTSHVSAQMPLPEAGKHEGSDIFFPGDFAERVAGIPLTFDEIEKPSGPATATVNVDAQEVITPVSRYLFGTNANVYMTQMVDQPVLIDHITKLAPHVIRFPGGNLSSVFFWNAEVGQPPVDAPAKLVDASGNETDPGYWYGKNDQSWTLSVDNYYNMLSATNSTGILTINYGYARYSTAEDPVAAAAHLAAEWVRYDAGRTKFWEIGNESNGSWQAGYRINTASNNDGQPEIITGDLYGKHFRVFADSMRKAAEDIGHTILIGAQLLAEPPASWWNATDRNWNAGVFDEAGEEPDFYIIHSYYTPFETNSGAAEILNSATTVTRDLVEYVSTSLTAAGLPPKPIALTEWNIFAVGSKQQVSFINGMHAAIVTGELIANKYAMACRWNLANGWSDGNDHGMFSQGDQPGVPKWHPRPAYFYLYYFRKYFGDHMIGAAVTGSPEVLAYASTFSSGEVSVILINKGTSPQTVSINIDNFGHGEKFYFHSLTGGTDNGSFSLKVLVNGEAGPYPAGGPADPGKVKPRASDITGGIRVIAPAHSVQYILMETGDNIITGVTGGKEGDISVFPNPAERKLTVGLPSKGFSKVEIRSFQGAMLFGNTIDADEVQFDLNLRLAAGAYIMFLHKEGMTYRRKIIIY